MVKDPLNSLKIREKGQETGRSWAACNPGQVNGLPGLSRAREVEEGREQSSPYCASIRAIVSPSRERDVPAAPSARNKFNL